MSSESDSDSDDSYIANETAKETANETAKETIRDVSTTIKTSSTSLNKVLSFLEHYANEGVLNEDVGSNNIEDAIKKVNKTYGFTDSYPPLSEKLSIIDKDREGYRLLLSGYNPVEMEKEKFDALVNGSYSDRLMSDKYASIYYAYHDGLKAFKEDQRQ